jgi:hypothetical protein
LLFGNTAASHHLACFPLCSGTTLCFDFALTVPQGQRVINPYESRWFWIVLVANPAVWVLLSLSALLGLDWGEHACCCCTCGTQK